MTDQNYADTPGEPGIAPESLEVTRSEEELRVNVRARPVERVRLVRETEIETVTRTVEVRHEQIRLERTPISVEDPLDPPAPASPAGEGWVVLYDEEVIVTTRRVPRERVRLRVESITEQREVIELLRKEQIEISDDRQPGPLA